MLPVLIDGLRLARDVVADRGYDARAVVDLITAGVDERPNAIGVGVEQGLARSCFRRSA